MLGAARSEAAVVADQLGHRRVAVAADVEVAEGEAAALVLRPALHPLARRRRIHERSRSPCRRRPNAVEERAILGEVDGGEIAHERLLRGGRRGGAVGVDEVQAGREVEVLLDALGEAVELVVAVGIVVAHLQRLAEVGERVDAVRSVRGAEAVDGVEHLPPGGQGALEDEVRRDPVEPLADGRGSRRPRSRARPRTAARRSRRARGRRRWCRRSRAG